jgi:hypothetical protein
MYQGQVNQYPRLETNRRDEKQTPTKNPVNGGWHHQMMSHPTEIYPKTIHRNEQGQDTAMEEVTSTTTHSNVTNDNETLDRSMEDTANTTNNTKENEKFVTLSTGADDGK